MRLKTVVRFLVLALIMTAAYFVFVRDHLSRRSSTGPQTTRSVRSLSPDDLGIRRHSHSDGSGHPKHSDQSLEADSGLSCSSEYFSSWTEPVAAACRIRFKDDYPVPDPLCTPGGINPSVSLNVLRDSRWRTRSVRNCDNSETEKHIAYRWYGIQKPRINSNQNQVCELDHLVPLELGGADGLGNIWPQCGPDAVTLNERYFKQKDRVENYLAEEVRSGRISLISAQRGIASDWTQYLSAATRWCQGSGHC
jgi:hypothetical protein